MFDNSVSLLEIVARTAIVYAAILLGLRLCGKREIGQLTPFDLVVIILVANAVQNAMTGPDFSVTGGLVAAGVLIGLNFVVRLGRQNIPVVRRLVEGEPTLLIHNGRWLKSALSKEGIDEEEVQSAMRGHGIADVKDVRMAVLETNGSISVVPMEKTSEPHPPKKRARAARKG